MHMILGITHLFGVIVGAGGAFASELMFLSSVKDEKISPTEMRFLQLGSKMVWGGLAIIVLSGALLFAEAPAQYLASPKFLAKMTIVGILVINGFLFHLSHIPRMRRHTGTHFPSSDEFMRKVELLLTSGAVSAVSWASAFILGAWRTIPYDYGTIMLAYLFTLGAIIGVVLHLKAHILPLRNEGQ